MNYCHKCHILCEDSPCPRCGNSYVYPPEPEDYVFLAEKEYPWSEMLEQALKDEGIPVVANDAVAGAWITTRLGARFERSALYVPYGTLDRAADLVLGLFDAPEFADFETEEEEP